jgi:hypothetical protein
MLRTWQGLIGALVIAAGVLVAAPASVGATTVIPPQGQLAGHTYSQWLVKWWKLRLAKPAGADACQQENGVETLIGVRRHEHATCRIPAGRPLYDIGPTSECSSIEKPPFYGPTPQARKRCARVTDQVRSYRLKLDGVRLPLGDPVSGRFVVATRDFKFKLAKHNVLGIDKPGGRASAYGEGFGFRHIEPGRHSVRSRLVLGDGTTFTQRYRIVVRGGEEGA